MSRTIDCWRQLCRMAAAFPEQKARTQIPGFALLLLNFSNAAPFAEGEQPEFTRVRVHAALTRCASIFDSLLAAWPEEARDIEDIAPIQAIIVGLIQEQAAAPYGEGGPMHRYLDIQRWLHEAVREDFCGAPNPLSFRPLAEQALHGFYLAIAEGRHTTDQWIGGVNQMQDLDPDNARRWRQLLRLALFLPTAMIADYQAHQQAQQQAGVRP